VLAHTLSKTCFYLFGDRIVVFLGLQTNEDDEDRFTTTMSVHRQCCPNMTNPKSKCSLLIESGHGQSLISIFNNNFTKKLHFDP
jgi:hypothetical protein